MAARASRFDAGPGRSRLAAARLGRLGPASLLVVLAATAPPAAGAETARPGEVLVDRIVAVVEPTRGQSEAPEVVTRFELEVEARLALAERARSLDAAGLAPPASLLDAVLGTVVDQLIIRREAERLDLSSVTDEQVELQRAELERRLGGPGSLERFGERVGAPPDLVESIVRRRAAVAVFVARNVALAVRVTDAEVERVHEAGDHPFRDRPLEEVRDELEAYLVALRQQDRLAEWLRELRARSRVRIVE